jgi:hypothetical protein
MKKYYRHNPLLKEKAGKLLSDIYAAFGWKTRLVAPLIGRYVFNRLNKEERLLAAGSTYEPRSHYELNTAALALETTDAAGHEVDMRQLAPMPEPAWQ